MTRKLRAWLLFLIFLNGYVSLSLELIVIRQLGFYVGSSAVITSIIMGIFLGFMSLGYFLGAANKLPKYGTKRALFFSFLTIGIIGVLATTFTLVSEYFRIMYAIGITSSIIQTFIYSLLFLSFAPFLFGYNTALLSRYLHKYNRDYTGNIMAVDTIGSVLGSLATTLLLMPFIGVNWTIVLITVLSFIGAITCRPQRKIALILLLVLAPAIFINTDVFLKRQHNIIVNNANSTMAVNKHGSSRVLMMNGLPMSVYDVQTGNTAEYINFINDNFIYNMPHDRRRNILILGAGGFTAGLNDTFNNYTFIDIERTLKDVAENNFLEKKLTPNKMFFVADASQYLKNTNTKYDLILLDVFSNSFQIPEGFITTEFMHRIKSRVASGGIILMNVIASSSFSDRFSRTFDNTYRDVFGHNFARQSIGYINPWAHFPSNIIYIYYNVENDGTVYTINKTPVIYDR